MSIRKLSKELQEKAEKELNEVPNRIPDDLNHIKEWITKQAHLSCRTDDQWLLSFLRGCKFSLERTKEKLDMFYTMRSLIPEFFDNRDPFDPDIQNVLKAGIILPLPKPIEADGPKIFYYHWNTSNPKDTITVLSVTKVILMVLEILLIEDDNATIGGFLSWIDLENFPLSLALQLTPPHLRKVVMCVQHSYPIRIVGAHHTNAAQIFESALGLLKSFMSDKMKNRICIYSVSNTKKEFSHIIPEKYKPKHCGGENGSVEELTEYWKNKVESYRDYFIEDYQFRSSEKLRPKKPRTSEDIFGIDGAFRKLTID